MAWYNWSQTAASNATADSSIDWAEGQSPSSVNDSARAMMAVTAKYRDDNNGTLTTGGTSTAYTLSTNSNYDTLAHLNGQTLTFTMNATSGVTPTLNVDSLGAKPIRQATGVALPTGALLLSSVYTVTYNNSTGEFLLINQPGVLASGSVNSSSIAAGGVAYSNIQNVTADRLLGNPTGSAAAPSEISLGAGLSFSGTSLVATPAGAQNYLSGLTLSTAGSSGTMSIAAGVANDSTNSSFMTLASAISKTTASWAVGSTSGGLDTGSIANSTWYHFYEIQRVDTGVVDVVFSLSASAPTLPTNYTLYRLIGSGKTDGSGHWTAFTQTGDDFVWATSVADVNNIATTASRVSTTLTVPTGRVVKAMFRGNMGTNGANTATLFTSLQETDQVPAGSSTGPSDLSGFSVGWAAGSFERITNTSAQIGVRSTGTQGLLSINTYGWKDTRGK